MTLVAVFEVNQVPILLGDIVLSRLNYNGPQIVVPTRTDLDEVLPRDWYRGITSVRRKLAVINKKLVVGWAGHFIAASPIISQLKKKFENKQVSQNDLCQFFEQTEDFGKGIRCIIIGWLVHDQGKTAFKWASATKTLSIDIPGYVTGSGANDFFRVANSSKFQGGSNRSNVTDAIHFALDNATNILGKELLTGHSLQQLYGGGIEIIYFENGEFKQLENVSYLFWSIGISDKDIGATMEPLIMTYRYIDDVLVISSERLEPGKQLNGFKSQRTALTDNFIILPVYKSKPHFDINSINPFTKIIEYFCNFCDVQFPDGDYKFVSFSLRSPDNTGIVRVKKLSKKERIGELEDIMEVFQVDMDRFLTAIYLLLSEQTTT